jgi:hypothetical protein
LPGPPTFRIGRDQRGGRGAEHCARTVGPVQRDSLRRPASPRGRVRRSIALKLGEAASGETASLCRCSRTYTSPVTLVTWATVASGSHSSVRVRPGSAKWSVVSFSWSGPSGVQMVCTPHLAQRWTVSLVTEEAGSREGSWVVGTRVTTDRNDCSGWFVLHGARNEL